MNKQEILDLVRPITVVKILEINKHPNADRLKIVKVDMGGKEKNVITGADNISIGDYVPYLGEGHLVPGYLFLKNEKITLQKKMLRGLESDCMILAEDEIGLSMDHGGIYLLNSHAKIKDIQLGSSLVDSLSENELNVILENAGFIEIDEAMQKRIDLIKSVASNGGEIVGTDAEIARILKSKETLYTYDGFEPSGQMHIAQGIIRAINTNKMIDAGFTFRMYVADWFGYLNNKMGGDLEKIKKVGKYFIELWKASGMNIDGVEFLWTSDAIQDTKYWELVLKIAKSSTLKRVLRTTEIMGRSESDDLTAAQIIYPCMQVADIFYVVKTQITELGMDQRKVNMLAREIGQELGFWKPVVISHAMLQGLGKPLPESADPVERAISMKMSKSKPETAIFMTDSKEEVAKKILDAYCPEGEVKDNPVLDYCKKIIFEAKFLKTEKPLLENGKFEIEREEKFGGSISFDSYEELEGAFTQKILFPLDLKNAVIKYINLLLEPVRKHFEENQDAKKLLEEVKSFAVTR